MKNLFIDTNIIFDVFADRKPFAESGAALFNFAEAGKIKLFISSLSYSTIYYVIKKQSSHKQIVEMLKDLEALTETIDVTKQIISKSLHSDFKDFEDAIQYNTALSNKKIEAIITRNGKDYKKSSIGILSPIEALSIIESIK